MPSTAEPELVDSLVEQMPVAINGPIIKSYKGSFESLSPWSPWSRPRPDLPIDQESSFIGAAAVSSWGADRLDVFAIAMQNGTLQHRYWDGEAWTPGWINLDVNGMLVPATVSRQPNSIDVFLIGIDKRVYHGQWQGKRWDWDDLGGTCIHGLAATSWSADRLDLFAVGTNSSLYHRYWNGTEWSRWNPVKMRGTPEWADSSTCISAPAAVSWAPGRIDLFAIGIDNHIYHAWTVGDGTGELDWQGWQDLGGPCLYGVAAATRGKGLIDLFTIGTDTVATDNHLYHLSGDGTRWGNWTSLGGTCISAPAAIARPSSDALDVFVLGTRNALWQKSWTSVSGEMGVAIEDEQSRADDPKKTKPDVATFAGVLKQAALSGTPLIEGVKSLVMESVGVS